MQTAKVLYNIKFCRSRVKPTTMFDRNNQCTIEIWCGDKILNIYTTLFFVKYSGVWNLSGPVIQFSGCGSVY
jgi:hypothetical protein